MQGRVIPEDVKKLQVFPISHWKEELHALHDLEVAYCELLYDVDNVCQRVLTEPSSRELLLSHPEITVQSACLDLFTSISSLRESAKFFTALTDTILFLSGTSVKTFVVPFFHENDISSKEDLLQVVESFRRYEIDEVAREHEIVLALELSLPAHQILSALRGSSFHHVRICYDLGNARASGFVPEEEIQELGDLIAHVHIKDRKPGGPNVLLGEGGVNFEKAFCALDTIDYQGLMILETKYFPDPRAEMERNLALVADSLKNARE